MRRITRIVQVVPYAYLVLLSVYLLFESALPSWAVRLSDNLLNAPVFATVGMLAIGRMLKLCAWFRTACLLPYAARIEGYIDSFLFQFTQGEIAAINTALAVLFLVFIVATINHFFLHGRSEEKHFRNPRLSQVQG